MKNVYLILLLIITAKSWSQGTDVIIWIDNSGSIDDTEFANMQTSIAQIFQNVLECNPNNRVAVVHYSANGSTPRIYIESLGFTNSAFPFIRRFIGEGGNAPAALNLISSALNNNIPLNSPNVLSPIKSLMRTPGNALVVYFFTDAERNNDLASNNTIGSDLAFTAYTNFKNIHNAKFIVTIIPPILFENSAELATNFAAAIASTGGNYMGGIESYDQDPDGPGALPRYLLVRKSFLLSSTEIEIVTDDICSVAEPPCVADLVVTSPVIAHDNKQASNSIIASNVIMPGGVGIYHADDTVVLRDGFHSANSSRFRAYIEGCSGIFEGRPGSASKPTENPEDARSIFTISLNPSTDKVTIPSDEAITGITITSLDGRVMFSRELSGKQTSYEVSVQDYNKGIYIVSINTSDGEVHTQKLIKD